MDKPLKITCRNIEHSAVIERLVRDREEILERFCDRISACHVLVEALARGGVEQLHVRIDLDVPGRKLMAVTDRPCRKCGGDAACAAIRQAFRDLQQQLQAYLEDGDATERPAHRRGRISALFHDMNYGKIRTSGGREVYFHRNSVLDDAFDRLAVGAHVRFIEQRGLLGPQATIVKLISRRAPGKPGNH